MSYWDTSALVKLSIPEADSAVFKTIAASASLLVTGSLSRLELRAVFRRREAEGALAAGGATSLFSQLEADIQEEQITIQMLEEAVEEEFANVLEACYSATPPVFIRTNDALHLASAIVAGEVEFVTADGRQRTAAELMGLTVLPTTNP